jgi:hypothetical protein
VKKTKNPESAISEVRGMVRRLRAVEIAELGISVRLYNLLHGHHIETLAQLLQTTKKDLRSWRGFGPKTLFELQSLLVRIDLELGQGIGRDIVTCKYHPQQGSRSAPRYYWLKCDACGALYSPLLKKRSGAHCEEPLRRDGQVVSCTGILCMASKKESDFVHARIRPAGFLLLVRTRGKT